MKILKALGLGALIYVVAFMVISVFIGFKVPTDSLLVKTITLLAVLITIILSAISLKANSIKEALSYSFIWVMVNFVLDILVTTRFAGWGFFGQWNIVLGYLLILIAPLLAVKKQ
ncbi:MAG: hypothetical protein NTV62_03015 [Candidatus Gribaldobacteria bacterium]|nr:hypothetical protein [Candidatus Gribaldobacteria bacterium]